MTATRDVTWVAVDGHPDMGIRSDERGHQAGCFDCGWRSEWCDLREDAQTDAGGHVCDDEGDE